MARLLLFLIFAVALLAILAFMVSVWSEMMQKGRRVAGPMLGARKGDLMAPNGYQKLGYVALIVLLIGVTSGWIGGL